MPRMKRVIVESPYAGDVRRNFWYLRGICRYLILFENSAPFASHGFYTSFLNDAVEDERDLGIEAGFVWGQGVERQYWVDFGMSEGMQDAFDLFGGRYRSARDLVVRDATTRLYFGMAGIKL